jgi:hypothetical protein
VCSTVWQGEYGIKGVDFLVRAIELDFAKQ